MQPDEAKVLRALRRSYLEAFRAANPASEPPRMSYADGWWRFRYPGTGVTLRYRTAQVKEMRTRLEARSV